MSKYLNELIKSLQAEAEEHGAALEQHAAETRRAFRRDTGYLDRLQQRIKSLQELQMSEAKRHRQLLRGAFTDDRARVSSPDVARLQGNASRQ
jgi:hypothetical protein